MMASDQVEIEFWFVENHTKAVLKRHLAPRTVGLIWKILSEREIQTRVVQRGDEVILPFKLGRIGTEKGRKNVEVGEVSYWPQSHSLCIYLASKKTYSNVNVIGTVENLEFFRNLKSGSSIRIRLFLREI